MTARQGVTLMEVVVAMAILAVLTATVSVSGRAGAPRTTRDALRECRRSAVRLRREVVRLGPDPVVCTPDGSTSRSSWR